MIIPDVTNYILYKTREHYLGLDQDNPNAKAKYYTNTDGTFSIGLYYYNNQKIYIAWGPKGSCAYHAILFTDKPVVGEGCINFMIKNNSIIFSEGSATYEYSL